MQEIWLTIEGLEKYYAFSNYGRIYNYKRNEYSNGTLNKKTGYYEKLLFKDGKLIKGGGIHKFIYEAFNGKIPKDKEINHKDGDKSNNAIWNLNLLSHTENLKWFKTTKTVLQYTKNGDFVAEYKSAKEAQMITGIGHTEISKCCRNEKHRKTAGGFIWKYK